MNRENTCCNRRQFLGKAAGLTLAGAAALPLVCQCSDETEEQKPGRPRRFPVVHLKRPQLLDEQGRIDGTRAPASTKGSMAVLKDALTALTGAKDLAGSLGTLFSPGERVGIKLNCLAGRGLSPQPPLVFALIESLAAVGIKKEDIIVFERSERELADAGFPVGLHKGVRFLGNDSRGMGYDRQPLLHKSIGSCFSRILTRKVDALINFGVLKDHNLAGVSVGLKNLFGLIHNPNKYHDDNCNPFVAHVLEAPPVRKKLRLTLCDGFVAQYQGGPGFMKKYTWKPGIFLASCDPVALDAVGARDIEQKRESEGLESLAEDGRAPAFIQTAADCGLGEGRLEKITIIEI